MSICADMNYLNKHKQGVVVLYYSTRHGRKKVAAKKVAANKITKVTKMYDIN